MTEQEALQELIDALQELEDMTEKTIKDMEQISKGIREIGWVEPISL